MGESGYDWVQAQVCVDMRWVSVLRSSISLPHTQNLAAISIDIFVFRRIVSRIPKFRDAHSPHSHPYLQTAGYVTLLFFDIFSIFLFFDRIQVYQIRLFASGFKKLWAFCCHKPVMFKCWQPGIFELCAAMGNHFFKTYSHSKSQYLLKRNSSPSTNRQARSLPLYYFTNVFFNFQIFDESWNMHSYQNFSTLGNKFWISGQLTYCHPLATLLSLGNIQ